MHRLTVCLEHSNTDKQSGTISKTSQCCWTGTVNPHSCISTFGMLLNQSDLRTMTNSNYRLSAFHT